MNDGYSFYEGTIPLLVSVPHDGRQLPADIKSRMTVAGRSLPDTDWHVERLYEFSRQLGVSMIVAIQSRYVVDLNRPADDEALYEGQTATGLCPLQTFSGDNLYVSGEPISAVEKGDRVESYWRPYHDKIDATLNAFRDQYGYALLWDAHSIPSRVPRLFDGELPVLNVGTWGGRSCDNAIANAVYAIAAGSSYESVLNGRFKGGYITRHYGSPHRRVHAIQLEVAQRSYMDETSLQFDEKKVSLLRDTLESMLTTFMNTASERMQ
jgi:N-formylglutamate deformylase